MTLTEFLLARIAEDETEIGDPFGRDDSAGPNGIGWAEVGAISEVLISSVKRARAECDAKRRIVEYATNQHTSCEEYDHVVEILAVVYADHQDYRNEWKP